jgi:hypothetical protein
MKFIMTNCAALALAAAAPLPVRADSWCLHDSAGVTSTICAFWSAQDCIQAAIVGPSGMVCTREDAIPQAPAPKAQARKGHAGHWRRQANT